MVLFCASLNHYRKQLWRTQAGRNPIGSPEVVTLNKKTCKDCSILLFLSFSSSSSSEHLLQMVVSPLLGVVKRGQTMIVFCSGGWCYWSWCLYEKRHILTDEESQMWILFLLMILLMGNSESSNAQIWSFLGSCVVLGTSGLL